MLLGRMTAAVVMLALVGCTIISETRPAPATPAATSATPAAATAATAAPADMPTTTPPAPAQATPTPTTTPAPEPGRATPAGFGAIGNDCPADAMITESRQHGALSGVLCGSDGKIAGVYVADAYLDAPAGWDEGAKTTDGFVKVAVKAPRVWVQKKTCPSCRKIIGWTFQGDVTKLKGSDLKKLQRDAGRKDETAMINAATWLRLSYLQ